MNDISEKYKYKLDNMRLDDNNNKYDKMYTKRIYMML